MKYVAALSVLANLVSGFAPTATRTPTSTAVRMAGDIFDQEQFIAESKEMRLKYLEEQAMFALKIAVENYGK